MTEKGKKQFAKNLVKAMEDAHLNQYQLAKRTGFFHGTISWWVHGTVAPRIYNMGILARTLGVDVKDLIKGIKVEDLL